jgi:hypothetical protein
MRERRTSLALFRGRQYHQAEYSGEAACITRQSTPTPKGVSALRAHLVLGAGYFYVKSHHMRRRFGLWLFTGPRSFEDPQIWREEHSFARQTPFQRAVGVRYVGRKFPRFPDSFTGFGTFVRRSRPRSVVRALKGWFHPGPVTPQHLSLRPGHSAVLSRATGYALISSRHLRNISLPGALFVGIVRVRSEDAT